MPPHRIRGFARRYLGLSDVDRVLDEHYLAVMREMHASVGYPRAYTSTVRSLARPEFFRPADELTARLAATGLPVLLIWGARDRLLPVERARLAHDRLPGSRLAVIEGAGHAPQSEQPEEFNRVLEDFLVT